MGESYSSGTVLNLSFKNMQGLYMDKGDNLSEWRKLSHKTKRYGDESNG